MGWGKEVSCIPKESDKIALPLSSGILQVYVTCPVSGTSYNLVMGTFEIQTITGLPWAIQFENEFSFFFLCVMKVLPVTPLLSGVFMHRVLCAYLFLRGLG